MALSQNGYRAYNGPEYFVRGIAAGFGFYAADADVRVIFAELITRFNAEVEPIAGKVLDDWSWNDRNVRDSDTQVSNHASATAIDLNALQHVRGDRNTFNVVKLAALRKILHDLPVIRWGGDYIHAPKDEMHYEINASRADVHALADKLRERDDVQASDVTAIAAAVMNALKTERVIPNPSTTGALAGLDFTVLGILQNIETTQDRQQAQLDEIQAALKAK